MRLLLDTHALIWTILAPDRLSSGATAAITADGAEVYASHVSLWEIAIKRGQGRLEVIDRPALSWFQTNVSQARLRPLPIAPEHLGGVESLPALHRDPFDRLLVTQAVHERLRLVTNDPLVERYDVACVW